MAACFELVTDGSSGQLLRLQDPQPPTLDGCAYVIQSGSDYVSNPFLLTRTEAAQIGIAIAALWLSVAVVKTIVNRL